VQARVQYLDAELSEARASKDQAGGEVAALRYVNTSLRAQIDEFMRSMPRPAEPIPEACRARPAVCRCLLNASAAVEVWRRGRLQVIEGDGAPTVGAVVQALLKVHGKRFKPAQIPSP